MLWVRLPGFRAALKANPASFTMEVKQPGHGPNHHHILVPESSMGRAIHVPPLSAYLTCSRENFTFTIWQIIPNEHMRCHSGKLELKYVVLSPVSREGSVHQASSMPESWRSFPTLASTCGRLQV